MQLKNSYLQFAYLNRGMVKHMHSGSRYMPHHDPFSSEANLLISILIRYPEVSSISSDWSKNLLNLTFILYDLPQQTDFLEIKDFLLKSISVYHTLENTTESSTDIEFSTCEQVTTLTFSQDIDVLSPGEINLIISVLKDRFKNHLVSDLHQEEPVLEDDIMADEELAINTMLESIKKQPRRHNLIGIREDGRVLVFNNK